MEVGIWARVAGFLMFEIVTERLLERIVLEMVTVWRTPLEIVEVVIAVGWFVESFRLLSTVNYEGGLMTKYLELLCVLQLLIELITISISLYYAT